MAFKTRKSEWKELLGRGGAARWYSPAKAMVSPPLYNAATLW
jgi:hypothetical protein